MSRRFSTLPPLASGHRITQGFQMSLRWVGRSKPKRRMVRQFEVAASIAALSAPASASVTNVVAGKAEVAAPTLVDHPSANVVERTSASSLISSASAERDQAPEGVQTANNIVRGSLHPTLSRPRRRL